MVLRKMTLAAYTHLPEKLRGLSNGATYRLIVSSALQALAEKVDRAALSV